MTRESGGLDQGDIRFYDNYVPTLGEGDYLVNVTQRFNPHGTTIDDCFAASQVFSVQGPRYALPPGEVYSVFPPDNGQGVFDQFLPHVVLSQRELPWENNVFGSREPAEQIPWLALLLFVEGEQIGGQPTLLPPKVAGWQPNRSMAASIPAATLHDHPTGDHLLWPALEKEWYETADFLQRTMVSVIDISPQAFTTLIPSAADLRYLAHVRQVDPTSKDEAVLKVAGDGWYSVVIGSRLPDPPSPADHQHPVPLPGRRNIVHLVSLEGLTEYVGGKAPPAGTDRVRLISLQSWSFTCVSDAGQSFSQIMNGLLADQQGTPKSTALRLQVPQPVGGEVAEQYAYEAIQNGYVPLQYQTRLGEQTFTWYRGPFSPVPVTTFIARQVGAEDPAGWNPFDTASSAVIYDKVYGVFDVSYGVAWETGRQLALADGSFGPALLDWERSGHRLVDLILERKSQIAALKGFDPNNPDPTVERTLLDLIEPYAVTDGFMQYLVTQFGQQITPTDGSSPAPPDQPFPPSPPPPSPPANPQTIADLLAETDVQTAIRAVGGQGLEAIADWLARRYLLTGVPFEALLANPALLPEESVRFFYLDANWLGTLIEGALSIGIQSSRDLVYQGLMKELIWNTTLEAVQTLRDKLLGPFAKQKPPGSTIPFDQLALTGMLLRSSVVSSWQGLSVHAYTANEQYTPRPDPATEIGLLRMDRLSDDVLLCLWPTIPTVVTIDEPHEGIAFGFEGPPSGEGAGNYLYARSVAPGDYGMPLQGASYQINAGVSSIIDPASRRVAISASGGLLPTLQSALPNKPVLQVRDFAVEMVKTPEQAVFAAQALAPPPMLPITPVES